jgi:glycosyltransferase involved in cell wall biosynthesis
MTNNKYIELNKLLKTSLVDFTGGFTVLMSVYANDNPIFFKKAIQSVFCNTLTPGEFILVVDGQVGPEINEIIFNASSLFPNLIIVRFEENLGLASALNIGMNYAKFEWIVRADADDINLSNRFELLAQFHRDNLELSLIGGWILEVDDNGNRLGVREVPLGTENIKRFVRRRNPFNHMSVAFRKKDVVAVGGYPHIYLREDYALWSKMIQCGFKSDNIPEILVLVSAGSRMYSRRGGVRYIIAEYKMQKFLVNLGLKNFICGLFDLIFRSVIFSLPSRARGYVYENILRRPIDKKASNDFK